LAEERKDEPKISFAGLVNTASRGVKIHERADSLPRPEFFYMEPGSVRRSPESKHNISKFHQVDPSRKPSLAGIMPNTDLLENTANPYPARPNDPALQGHMTWAPYVDVSHAYWWVLSQAKGPLTGAEIGRRAVPFIPSDVATRMVDIEHSWVGGHTLRDLRLYGLIGSDAYREDVWSTVWAITDEVRCDFTLLEEPPIPPPPTKPRLLSNDVLYWSGVMLVVIYAISIDLI